MVLCSLRIRRIYGRSDARRADGKRAFRELSHPFGHWVGAAGFLGELLAGKYGLISMGLTYAIAIVLPVVATFFIAFGLMEDSGYLPRLAISPTGSCASWG